MDLNEISMFTRVVQEGSFTGAARRLDQPKSTVSAKVQALEKRLGVSLLHRTTRKLHLTAEGEAFFKSAVKALADLEAAEESVQSHGKPRGTIKVTAPLDLGIRFMPQFLPRFAERYPDVTVDLLLTGRIVDIIEEGVDVAIRAATMRDSSLVARKITNDRFQVFASPKYLDQAGRPKHPDDLTAHRCVRHSRTQMDGWELMKGKTTVKVPISGPVAADELSAIKELVEAGMGIGLFPQFVAAESLANGTLELVLPDWYWQVGTLFLAYPAQRHMHPKVRVFIDEAVTALKEYFDV